jgi:hypothetical protein
MKLILSFLLFFSFGSFAQLKIVNPTIYYVSKWTLEDLQELPVGSKILFQQQCTTEMPKNIPTGVILFENVYHQNERFSTSIEFKDTVVVSVTYYLTSKQKSLLAILGYSNIKANSSAVKGQWTYTMNEDNRLTVIVGDKKRIVVVQTNV